MPTEEERKCELCGATGDLICDPVFDYIWYCRSCLERDQGHQAAIDHGLDDEDPRIE